MRVRVHKLIVTGPGKEDALIDFKGQSHLVFGPTDTGKSYIVECLKYCLGSDTRPRDVGYSEGYTRIALQVVTQGDEEFTIFRDLTEGGQAVYKGFHTLPPQNGSEQLDAEIAELVVTWALGSGRKILIKSGTLGNLAAGDLRHISLFDEIETLDKVPLEGKDKLFKVRTKSSIALILSGSDDSQIVLTSSSQQRDVAKGHIEALEEEIQSLRAEIPDKMTRAEANDALSRVTAEIEQITSYLRTHAQELAALKAKRVEIDHSNQVTQRKISALLEAENRFELLHEKYGSDLQRLQAISAAAAVVGSFEEGACPLCRTDIRHQTRHKDEQENRLALRQAAQAESLKIKSLQEGLSKALGDIAGELEDTRASLISGRKSESDNLAMQAALLSPASPDFKQGLSTLSERKTTLAMAVRDLEKVGRLENRLASMKARAKRRKQSVERDLSRSETDLCAVIKSLLVRWGVPGVESVHFDQSIADIHINHRRRISFGKGKRGIFLTAYVVALMEYAIQKGHPHLGLVVIDSPVVTYKDPKHGSPDPEEALDVKVKDRFYAWLAERTEPGQVIILENEEPEGHAKQRLLFTEFGGAVAEGRSGFFPRRS